MAAAAQDGHETNVQKSPYSANPRRITVLLINGLSMRHEVEKIAQLKLYFADFHKLVANGEEQVFRDVERRIGPSLSFLKKSFDYIKLQRGHFFHAKIELLTRNLL